jgi:mediator of RNA polymerase II transcription subunit 17, fungi type
MVLIYRVAFEESSLAQDFISLLLSSVRPAAGGASMSPALKAAVPVGSLAGARIFPQGQKQELDISIGWKKSALEDACQTLIKAADRMSQDSGGAGKFVEGVLKIRAAGWGIVQMPATGGEAQQGILKVFYGFQKGIL